MKIARVMNRVIDFIDSDRCLKANLGAEHEFKKLPLTSGSDEDIEYLHNLGSDASRITLSIRYKSNLFAFEYGTLIENEDQASYETFRSTGLIERYNLIVCNDGGDDVPEVLGPFIDFVDNLFDPANSQCRYRVSTKGNNIMINWAYRPDSFADQSLHMLSGELYFRKLGM